MDKESSKGLIYLLLLGCIPLFFYYQDIHYDHILSEGTATIGIVLTDGSKLRIRYEVGSVEYITKRRFFPYQTIQDGECFEVRYNIKDPEDVVAAYHRPVIEDSLFAITTTAGLESVSELNEFETVKFTYTVDGKNYEKVQKATQDLSEADYKATYPVRYHKKNPAIAYVITKDSYVIIRK